MYVNKYVCTYVYIYICVCVCVCVCLSVCMCVCVCKHALLSYVFKYTKMSSGTKRCKFPWLHVTRVKW